MPGVSIRQPPCGNAINARCVVVCRPLASASRTPWVFIFSTPSRVLVSVDLPAPEEPTSTADLPGDRYGCNTATWAGSLAFRAYTGMPLSAKAASWPVYCAGSPHLSSLLSTSTGRAPEAAINSR